MAKYLDFAGVQTLWNKIKSFVTNQVEEGVSDKLGVADGIATLDGDGKLSSSQLPALKTINGSSIVGDGNITLDMTLYKIVDSLPESDIDDNKIYLVVDSNNVEGNLYDEYIHTDNKWEKLGSYRASVELDGYMKENQAITEEELESIFSAE